MFSLWQVVTICVVSSALCTRDLKYREISDLSRVCLATYSKRLNYEVLRGRWYYIYKFGLWLNLPPSSECRQILFERPNEQDLFMYKDYYNSTGMPYSFEEGPLSFSVTNRGRPGSRYFDGLLLGEREAKFFLRRPANNRHRESYDVRVYRYIDENYLVYEDCSLGGFVKWLISRKKNPSDEEVQAVINSQPDLEEMETQKFCELEED